jgi:hypothetical protein
MERQRCMVDAIIEEARPLNLLRRYQALAAVGQEIVRTDIPSRLMPAFVDLATAVKNSSVRSVVFRKSQRFAPSDPDFPWVRSQVRKALRPPAAAPDRRGGAVDEPTPRASAGASPSSAPAAAEDPADSCAYRPVR